MEKYARKTRFCVFRCVLGSSVSGCVRQSITYASKVVLSFLVHWSVRLTTFVGTLDEGRSAGPSWRWALSWQYFFYGQFLSMAIAS